ncbi:MAG: hypothetical protein WD036_04055 [Bauldia sp.]
MITRDEIARSLNGAWLLFLDRPNAIRLFDASYQGFWRSFQAIILIAPVYAVTILADRRILLAGASADATFNEMAFMAAKWLALAFDWITLPLLLAALATFLGIRRNYPAYIVARNWSTVLIVLPFAAIALIDLSGLLSSEVLFFPSVLALAIALRFSYLIARRALAVGVEVAIGFVVLDFLVSLALARLISRLLGVDIAV